MNDQPSTSKMAYQTEQAEFFTTSINPLLMPEITDIITSKLPRSSSLIYRLVCKSWHISWLRVASRSPPNFIIKLDNTSIRKLPPLLETCANLQIIFRSVQFYTDILRIKESSRFLDRSGYFVKCLEIVNMSKAFAVLKSILETKSCPNIEELVIKPEEKAYYFEQLDLESDELKFLKKLSIYFPNGGYQRAGSCYISILKSSPNLKVLKIDSHDNAVMFPEFFKRLAELPEITRNLEDLWLTCHSLHEINPLEKFVNEEVQLSAKLKTLTLKLSQCLSYSQPMSDAIFCLLSDLKRSLEKLTIFGDGDKYNRNQPSGGLEVLPKLKTFNNYANELLFPFPLYDILIKMPNLEKLILSHYKVPIPAERVDSIFSQTNLFDKNHLNLKVLIILGNLNSPNVPFRISKTFPNLSKFVIGLYEDKVKTDSEEAVNVIVEKNQDWFEEVFQGFSEMQNLTELTLDFGNCKLDGDISLRTSLIKLQHLSKLRNLILISNKDVITGITFVSGLLDLILDSLPRKFIFQLFNFRMLESAYQILMNHLAKESMQFHVEFLEGNPLKKYRIKD